MIWNSRSARRMQPPANLLTAYYLPHCGGNGGRGRADAQFANPDGS